MTTTATPTFLPAEFDPSDFANIEPLGRALQERPLESIEDLRTWMTDLGELFAVIWEYATRKNIDNACYTEDKEKEAAYLHWVREIQPRLKPLFFDLQKQYLEAITRHGLPAEDEAVMRQQWQADVELFRESNIPLQTRETELETDYGKVMGAMTIEVDGETCTLQQAARFLEETDRAKREEVWKKMVHRRLEDRDRVDQLFENLLDLRAEIATNASHENYRSFMWQTKYRFDYTPQDCLDFGEAVANLCVPLIDELDKQRRDTLAVDPLRPWDGAVDVKGRSPLRPFAADDIDGFVSTTQKVFGRISRDLALQFISLRDNGNLDLDSRLGKRPGGFQASLEASRQPFIFMNAAGLHADVETLIHEGGHAFHYLAARDIPNVFTRHAPLEFCEVASMSMELLACDHMDVFYDDPDQASRAKRKQLEGAVRVLPWVATIDGFQHWLYTHPGHDLTARRREWLSLLDRFGGHVTDWSGYEEARESLWQRQLHLFQVPFYYIEYGIAQLGALRVWLNYREDPDATLSGLRSAFALGGTRPLPELFAAAGIPFRFDEQAIRPLVQALRAELAALPQ